MAFSSIAKKAKVPFFLSFSFLISLSPPFFSPLFSSSFENLISRFTRQKRGFFWLGSATATAAAAAARARERPWIYISLSRRGGDGGALSAGPPL